MDKANIRSKQPLSLANSSVLNPMIRKIGKIISATVARIAIGSIKLSGKNGFNCFVYATKFSQFPQTEISLLHNPNLSATADKKLIESDNRKNSLINFIFIFSAVACLQLALGIEV